MKFISPASVLRRGFELVCACLVFSAIFAQIARVQREKGQAAARNELRGRSGFSIVEIPYCKEFSALEMSWSPPVRVDKVSSPFKSAVTHLSQKPPLVPSSHAQDQQTTKQLPFASRRVATRMRHCADAAVTPSASIPASTIFLRIDFNEVRICRLILLI